MVYQWTESDIDWYLEKLASYRLATYTNAWSIASLLSALAELDSETEPQPVPTGNARVIAHLERLLEDRHSCPVYWRVTFADSNYTYGELRWLAARVLACEYAYQGIETPIILKDVVQPIKYWGFVRDDERYDRYMTFDDLIQQGLLPTETEIIKPQDYCKWCSKAALERRRKQDQKS